jgi:tetratricopeptide (TPR) repeat protein
VSKAPVHARESIEMLLRSQRHAEAAEAARAWLARNPRSVEPSLLLVRALLPTGRLGEAHDAAIRGLRVAPGDHRLELFGAVIEHRLGRSDEAIPRLERLVAAAPPNEVEASLALAEALHRAGRHEAFDAFAAKGGRWTRDSRAAVFLARAVARRDREEAIAMLRRTFEDSRDPILQRLAGFEAVKHLDAAARYEEAFELATRVHEATTPRYDLGELERDLAEQRRRLAAGRGSFPSRAEAAEGAAIVVGLPRSGTTLLEQMLDRHPKVAGIGEYEGIYEIGEALVAGDHWPSRMLGLGTIEAKALAAAYREGARHRATPDAEWTFDKTLLAWRWLPAIAAVLPGARLLRITRDPRDAAISMFLSNFHPRTWGATASLDSIRRLVELERAIVPAAMETLGLAHVSLTYESLVADPRGEIARCLDLLGLSFDEAVLSPERNERTVLTLSHEQVRRPINASSIGRWRNYAFAFDGAWDALAESA